MSSRPLFAFAFAVALLAAAAAHAQALAPAQPVAPRQTAAVAELARPVQVTAADVTVIVRVPEAASSRTLPPDGYMEAEQSAREDVDGWFVRYGQTLLRAE